MNAQEAIQQTIVNIGKLFLSKPTTDVLLDDWEGTYTTLRGIKGFWDDRNWNEIEKAIDAEWISIARNDEAFKEYYSLRKELDRLENLV